MSAFQTIIIYSIIIVAFYGFILWFISKAGRYFKKLDDKMNRSLNNFSEDPSVIEPENSKDAMTPEETIEYLKKNEPFSQQIEAAKK